MKNIPVRSIKSAEAKPDISESFKIRTLTDVLGGKDMIHDLHRHDFYFILALTKGDGSHDIDFVSYPVRDNSLFLIRPGQVHQLVLKMGSEGFLMELGKDFFYSSANSQLLRKASNKTFCQLDQEGSIRLQNVLTAIHEEFTNKKEGFREIIKANLSIFFIELARQRQHTGSQGDARNDYAQERLQDFFELLETDISEHKQVSHYAEIRSKFWQLCDESH